MEFKHISVLFGESIDALNIKPNGIYADGTLGGGGHSHGILSTNDSCRLIGIDQDKEAIAAANLFRHYRADMNSRPNQVPHRQFHQYQVLIKYP